MTGQARLVDAKVENPLREGAVFVVLTFLIAAGVYLPLLASDRGWIAVTLPPTLSALGVVSPGLAAIALHVNEEGVEGLHSVLDGLTSWRFGRSWWAVTLALPPVFYVAVAAVNLAVGIEFSPEPVRFLVETGPAIVLPILLITVLGAGEEIGWRGYLLPRLQARMGALAASLLLGVIWFAWHLPLFLQGGPPEWTIPARGVWIISGAVIYTWLFNNTGGSVLGVTLFHAGTNIWGRLIGAHPMVTGDVVSGYILSGANLALALLLIVAFGARSLTDGRRELRFWR